MCRGRAWGILHARAGSDAVECTGGVMETTPSAAVGA